MGVLSIDNLAGHKVFYQKESHSWREQVRAEQSQCKRWRKIKAGRKLDFPKFQRGGYTRRKKVVREREREEIDSGIEINILHQQIGSHFAF